jgi:lipoic acid synthetase
MSDTQDVLRIPEWLRRPPGSSRETSQLKKILRTARLHTVCEEARCPNISECFSRGTATFMILGDVCTRGCRFCSVNTGKPAFSSSEFENEAVRVAEAAKSLGLSYVVITSVARDDLADGGASGFVATIREVRKALPHSSIEILIPDLRGNWEALYSILDEGPDVLNHNLETVPRLYRKVRPGASYARSLELLRISREKYPQIKTKTGIMLGLGEKKSEVHDLFQDSIKNHVDIFTAGQYMRPGRSYLPVEEYITPEDFSQYEQYAKSLGFQAVFIGPLVRSSYHAGEMQKKSFESSGLNMVNTNKVEREV